VHSASTTSTEKPSHVYPNQGNAAQAEADGHGKWGDGWGVGRRDRHIKRPGSAGTQHRIVAAAAAATAAAAAAAGRLLR